MQQLETRKQDESYQRIQDLRKKKEKSSRQRKKSEGKEEKNCFEEEIVDAPFESNINTVIEKHLIKNYTC